MHKITIPYFSGSGHTKKLAQLISEAIELTDLAIAFPIDVEAISEFDWDLMNESEAIIFGSPTYMGSMAARYKAFLEETSSSFWLNQKWANKIAGAFTIGSAPSGDKLNTLLSLSLFAAEHGMIWAGFNHIGSRYTSDGEDINYDGSWLGLMATSSPDKSEIIRPSDAASAELFGIRIAKAVERWNRRDL